MGSLTFSQSLSPKALRMVYIQTRPGSTETEKGKLRRHPRLIQQPAVFAKVHQVVLDLMAEGLILRKMLEGTKLLDTLIRGKNRDPDHDN